MTEFNPQHFLWRQEGRVGVITLNRPDRKNPLTFESYAELRDLFRALVGVESVRAIVLTGAGGNFCSGGDVHEIIGPLTKMNYAGLLDFTRMTGDLVKAMRFGTPRTKTAFLFTRVGLAGCDMGACALLPRIIGQGRASELLFTGRSMSSEEGAAWGFFNRVVEPEKVLEESLTLARELAGGPTFAHAMTKKMLHVEWDMPIDVAIDAEAEAQAVCMQTEDFARAYRAFAAKQKPQFEGN
jgi:enoyl-CoA hydratase/carnithine racemase